jgi:hypothetical protein
MRQKLAVLAVGAALLASGRQAHAVQSSLGVGVGYVKPERIEATLLFTGDFRFHLSKTFALAPEFSYWKKSQTALGVSASLDDLQFGANALAVLHPSRRVEVFGGAGGGLHHLNGAVVVSGSPGASNAVSKGGVDVLGGVDIEANAGLSFYLAARYDWVLGISSPNPNRLNQSKFYGGFRVRF